MAARNRVITGSAILIVAIAICFSGVVQNDFITLDDRVYILANPVVKAGLSWNGIAQVFTTVPFSYWQPLAFLSHMVDVQFFGLDAGAHHVVSVAWHAANTALLFIVLVRLTGAINRSFLVAALFALHPMHVESVAWIASRKDLVSGFFFIAGLLAYSWYCERRTALQYVSVCLAFALGLMAKPSIIAFPVILLLLDFWPLRRFTRAAIVDKIPLFVLAAISATITMSTIAYSGQLATDLHTRTPETPPLFKALIVAAQYLPKFVWPDDLSIFYVTEHFAHGLWQALAWAAVVLGISAAAIRFRRRAPYAFVGWFWFLVLLLPTLGMVTADRFSYLPFIGLSIVVVWGVADLIAGHRILRIGAGISAAAVLIILGALCSRQVLKWRNSDTIFREALTHDPDNYMVRQWLGATLGLEARFPEAIQEYEEALRLHPNYFLVELNCARAYRHAGSEAGAIRHYKAATRLRPEDPGTYKELGDVLLTQGDLHEAQIFYKKAQELHYPDSQKLAELLHSLEAAHPR
jgi:tetratricopeptide (TPR) repeat protein